MAKYTTLSQGFDVSSDSYIDKRLVLTKAEMLTAEDDYFLPDVYFAFCPDDQRWYYYNINNDESPETGRYIEVASGLVNDVIVNGESVVVDKIATLDTVFDVKVDGSSVVEDGIANIDLADKQDKLTAGQNIKIDNNIISVEGLTELQSGYGLIISEGTVRIDDTVVPDVNDIPTSTNDLTNDSGFITKAVLDLENYYLKNETYNKDEVNDLISSISGGITLQVVALLPLIGESNVIYLQRREVGSNIYDQWVWFNNDWVQVGSTEVDFDNYFTKDEVTERLAQKQDYLTAGQGINLSGSYISVDLGNSMTTTGNSIDVKQATPYQKGIVSYDDSTIKMNANGQLYSVGGGSGGSYVAGENVQINGNVISATDTKYRAGDGIKIDGDLISAKTDNETIFTNRLGELAIQAVPIDEGSGIKISRDGVISIVPTEVAEALNLDDYQEKLIAGDNIQINGNVISATGGGSGGSVSWGSIGGTLSNQYDLNSALNGKQKQLVAGSNITITDLSATQAMISASGGPGGSNSFIDITGSPYDNAALSTALNSKRNTNTPILASEVSGLANVAKTGSYYDLSNTPTIGNGTLTITQNGVLKGTFSANQAGDKIIDLEAGGGGGGGTVNNATITIQKNGQYVESFTTNQGTDEVINILVPTFSFDSATGVLTITDNN